MSLNTHRLSKKVVPAAILLAAAACGSPPPPTDVSVKPAKTASAPAAAPARAAYRIEEVEAPGQLTGRISLVASVPSSSPLKIDHDLACCVVPLQDETLRVSQSGGVANAVVYMSGIEAGKAWGSEAAALDNVQCRFDPHVLVVRAGAPVTVRNSDHCVHNVNTFARRNPPTNATLPPEQSGGRPVNRTFAVPEEVKVVCDAHGWMSAWLVVRDNPYFAVTDDQGRFQITGVPPGRHRAVIWHERLGRVETEVEVPAGGDARLDHAFEKVQG